MVGSMNRFLLFVPIVLLACSVTRPALLPTPSPTHQGRSTYPALRVTDSAGRARWVYNAWVDGDTLRGLRSPDMLRERIALPINQVRAVAAPRFSPGRTVGLIAGLGGVVMAVFLLTPDPVYVGGYP